YCQLRRVRWTSSGPWPPRSRRQKPTGRIYSAGVPVRDVASPPMPAPPPPPPPPPPRPPAPKRTGFAPKTPHGVLQVDWPFFGELCRALALKIFREYDPDVVIGIAKAGVIPGAVVASILQRDFASVAITRQETGARPVVMAGPPRIVAGRRVLIVDETCDSGDTMKLALGHGVVHVARPARRDGRAGRRAVPGGAARAPDPARSGSAAAGGRDTRSGRRRARRAARRQEAAHRSLQRRDARRERPHRRHARDLPRRGDRVLVRQLGRHGAARAAPRGDALGHGGGAARRHHRKGARVDWAAARLAFGPGQGRGLPRHGRAGGAAARRADGDGRHVSGGARSRSATRPSSA